jgi:large-conductance mechanosensitive channel
MQIIVDFLEWISKINLIDISIFVFYIINAGLIIFFIIKGIQALRKLYKKDNLKK